MKQRLSASGRKQEGNRKRQREIGTSTIKQKLNQCKFSNLQVVEHRPKVASYHNSYHKY